jgi:hypothetical protein
VRQCRPHKDDETFAYRPNASTELWGERRGDTFGGSTYGMWAASLLNVTTLGRLGVAMGGVLEPPLAMEAADRALTGVVDDVGEVAVAVEATSSTHKVANNNRQLLRIGM